MKAALKIIFGLILLISCGKNEIKNDKASQPSLIKIGFYPTFHRPAETILNFNEKYLLFYSPTMYVPEAVPPPRKDGKINSEEENKYQQYVTQRPELIPFETAVTEKEILPIKSILKSFTEEDFSDKNLEPGIDGMSTNIIIYFSDGRLIQINPMNSPKNKQYELYREVLNLLILKNTNKNDSIILEKIKDYH